MMNEKAGEKYCPNEQNLEKRQILEKISQIHLTLIN